MVKYGISWSRQGNNIYTIEGLAIIESKYDYVEYRGIVLWNKQWENRVSNELIERDYKIAKKYVDIILDPLNLVVTPLKNRVITAI